MSYNLSRLQEEMDAAGLPADAGDGYVNWKIDSPTQQQRDAAAVIIASHNPALLSRQQEIDAARDAVIAGRQYLQRQLASVSPDNLTALVNTIKPVVDGNTYLLRMVNNKIDVMSVAFVWTALTVKNPVLPIDRARYIEAVAQIIALLG